MNKTKRVAWHKHLKNEKKLKEKQRLAKANGTAPQQTPARSR